MTSTEAIFIGANRQTHVADIHVGRKTIAFGAGSSIALWNPLDHHHRGVHATLKGHTKEVTCVRFFKGQRVHDLWKRRYVTEAVGF
ncbi:unnamed protein product [Cyberlindnera jadinii]|uniref:Uncharacterized protein n=1 Tax=Cyberlindnera jadinii (strain ATCC 18201 / CBS 1600 / BCRC 20928 / JCM 3617 / NBRC 0987 / NRRL Y-1542) TaxID=983966 RepID=A0A0H5C2M6_CYBJN|nr:unnamed protein product [Cyberlindnera jadinii]